MSIPSKKVEIFCGTGGVGKTTLATSRAVALSASGAKVLLITIDPAKRLKQVLGLSDSDSGHVVSIKTENFLETPSEEHFDALLLSPAHTLERIAKAEGLDKELDNRILKVLTKPYGGMNEIMAVLEVQFHLSSGVYDTVVLDTPPGKHFIDFLGATRKIEHFFDKSFVEIFKFLGKKVSSGTSSPKKFLGKLVSSGIKKLLSYLEKVTGGDFVDIFIDAVSILYRCREHFTSAIDFQHELGKKEFSNWFLVSSAEHHKVGEAMNLFHEAESFMHSDNFLAVNKCLKPFLDNWHPEQSKLKTLKSTMLTRENELKMFAGKNFNKVLEFSEILSAEPKAHVTDLASGWKLLPA